MCASAYRLLDCKKNQKCYLGIYYIYFIFHYWFSRSSLLGLQSTSDLSSDSQHYLLRLCSENKAVFFPLHITSLVIKIFDFQNSWQFELVIHEAEMNMERSCTAVLILQCQQLHRLCRGALFEGEERSVHQRDASSLPGQTITRCLTEGCVAGKEHLWGWFLRGGHEKRSEEIGLVFPSVWVLHFPQSCMRCECGESSTLGLPVPAGAEEGLLQGEQLPSMQEQIQTSRSSSYCLRLEQGAQQCACTILFPGPRQYPY